MANTHSELIVLVLTWGPGFLGSYDSAPRPSPLPWAICFSFSVHCSLRDKSHKTSANTTLFPYPFGTMIFIAAIPIGFQMPIKKNKDKPIFNFKGLSQNGGRAKLAKKSTCLSLPLIKRCRMRPQKPDPSNWTVPLSRKENNTFCSTDTSKARSTAHIGWQTTKGAVLEFWNNLWGLGTE